MFRAAAKRIKDDLNEIEEQINEVQAGVMNDNNFLRLKGLNERWHVLNNRLTYLKKKYMNCSSLPYHNFHRCMRKKGIERRNGESAATLGN